MIEQEINKIINECHIKTRELVAKHQDVLENLAKELLEKESLDLLDIVRILGDRPYGTNEAIKEYMREIEIRKQNEKEKKKLEEEKKEAKEEDKDDDFDQDAGLRDGTEKKDEDENKGLKEPIPNRTAKRITEAEKVMDNKEN